MTVARFCIYVCVIAGSEWKRSICTLIWCKLQAATPNIIYMHVCIAKANDIARLLCTCQFRKETWIGLNIAWIFNCLAQLFCHFICVRVRFQCFHFPICMPRSFSRPVPNAFSFIILFKTIVCCWLAAELRSCCDDDDNDDGCIHETAFKYSMSVHWIEERHVWMLV